MHTVDLSRHVDLLRAYFAAHGTIPSAARLAELWGFSAKSWALQIVDRLRREGFLEDAPGRRLRPGPRFFERTTAAEAEPGSRRARRAPSPHPRDPIEQAAERWTRDNPGLDPQGYALAFRIARVAGLIEDGFRQAARRRDLSGGELLVLDALRRLGPPNATTPKKLKSQFLISFAGIGKRIDRLEQRGYIERLENPDDRRSNLIRLSPAGVVLLREISYADRDAAHIAAILALAPQERNTLSQLLKAIQARLEQGVD